jgi:hypothetical protein
MLLLLLLLLPLIGIFSIFGWSDLFDSINAELLAVVPFDSFGANLALSVPSLKSENSPNTPHNNAAPIIPVKVYPDAAACKEQILKENKGKSGVYLIFFC